MSRGWRPVDGDEITTTAAPTPAQDDVHTAETSAAPVAAAVDDDEVVRITSVRPTVNWQPILIVAVAVLVALQVVIGFLALGSINQVRDQVTSSNGLQKCLINAQLAAQGASDQTAYTNAVKACASK